MAVIHYHHGKLQHLDVIIIPMHNAYYVKSGTQYEPPKVTRIRVHVTNHHMYASVRILAYIPQTSNQPPGHG